MIKLPTSFDGREGILRLRDVHLLFQISPGLEDERVRSGARLSSQGCVQRPLGTPLPRPRPDVAPKGPRRWTGSIPEESGESRIMRRVHQKGSESLGLVVCVEQ